MRATPRTKVVIWILSAVMLLHLPWQARAVDTVTVVSPPRVGEQSTTSIALPEYNPTTQRLIMLINQARWEHGRVPPLKIHPVLQRAAQNHSQSMAKNDFFGHKGPNSSSPWDRIDAAGYQNWYVLAENIAVGYKSPEEVLQAWLDSPRHRDNLLNPELYEAGVGLAFEPDDVHPGGTWGYQYYWTLDMGTRWDALPVVINGEAYSTTKPLVSLYLYGQGWATEMRLSNDGRTWTEWQPFQSNPSWELSPEDGLKNVYAQLRDQDQNIIESADMILLKSPSLPESPPLDVFPRQVAFVLARGRFAVQPRLHRLQITYAGDSHSWQASWDQSWLRLSTTSGTTPSDIVLTLSYRARFLPVGIYTTTLSIADEKEEVDVPVTLLIVQQVYTVYLPILPQ